MSTCWKCGKDLPPGQVECEFCDGTEAAASHELEREFKSADEAVQAIIEHLENMGASKCTMSVTTPSGDRFVVTVTRIAE